MPTDNNLGRADHRLGSSIVQAITCGCDGQITACCHVVDLGVVHEEEPDYKSGDPCEPTRVDTIVVPPEGDPYCVSVPDPEPYGSISEYQRACARLVVWEGASIGSEINYSSRKIYYSRQRADLPSGPSGCGNPIYCPSENGIHNCDGTETEKPEGNKLKYPVSNCVLPSDNVVLAGYAINDSWWFIGDSGFSDVENQIIENCPWGEDVKMTIYAHFQVEWKAICCNRNGGIEGSPCFGEGIINGWNDGRCGGNKCWHGLNNKEERERAVKITAAVGYSLGDCGYQIGSICS